MWFVAVTVGCVAVTVIATHGSWRQLAHLPIRGGLLLVAGLMLQAALEYIEFANDRIETTGYALLMLSYVFLIAFCLVNLPLRGMSVIAVGIALNAVVIGLNQGMPTRPVAIENGERVERPIERSVKHRPESPDDLVGFLGDKILLPEPVDTIISIGDIVLVAGLCELAYFGSRKRRKRSRQRPTSSPRRSSTRSSAASTRPSYT